MSSTAEMMHPKVRRVYESEVKRMVVMGFKVTYTPGGLEAEPLHDARVMRVLAASQQLYELSKAPAWLREGGSEDWWRHEYQKALAALPRTHTRVVVSRQFCAEGTGCAVLEVYDPEWGSVVENWMPVGVRQVSLRDLAANAGYLEHVGTVLRARARIEGHQV